MGGIVWEYVSTIQGVLYGGEGRQAVNCEVLYGEGKRYMRGHYVLGVANTVQGSIMYDERASSTLEGIIWEVEQALHWGIT